MKSLRKFLAMALAVIMTVSLLTIGAVAAEIDPTQSDVPKTTAVIPGEINAISATSVGASYPFLIGGDESFTRVVYKAGGINCDVKVEVLKFAPSQYQLDIMMYGKNGLLSREDDCLGNSSSERTFPCGADVTAFWVRIIPRNKLFFPATAHDFAVLVTYPV